MVSKQRSTVLPNQEGLRGGHSKLWVKANRWPPFYFLLLLFKFIFSNGYLLYNIVLVSAIHQQESARGNPISPLSWTSLLPPFTSHSSRLSQSIRLSSLSHTANSHLLSILYMVVYMFPRYSLHSSHPLLLPLPLCPSVCSLCLHLDCCPTNRFINTIFLDAIYMH